MNKVALFGRLASAGLASSMAVATAAQPKPGFWLVGNSPGHTIGFVTSLTSDGSMAAGYSFGTSPKITAASFTWTPSGGRNDYGLLPGMPAINEAYGVSDRGVTAGTMRIDGEYDKSRAYRWTGRGPLQDLGVLPGETRSFAWGISGDGSVVVGHAETGTVTGEAFRWTAATGMKGIGKLTPGSTISMALAVSRDGMTIVGENWNEFLNTDAFVWTQASGMKALPKLGNPWNTATADAVNADGTIIVGRSVPVTGGTRMVRWKYGAIEDLVAGLPISGSWGLAVSDNGEAVAGTHIVGGTSNTALVWTAITGAMDLDKYLASNGVQVPAGYKLEYAYAVSGDGLTFGGSARNLNTNIREGFVAAVSSKACKPDCDASGGLDIDDFICFQTRFAISDPYADCDASGELDIDDFICFQTFFAVGC